MSLGSGAVTFEERGILPPSKDAVTVGESDLQFVHLQDGTDTKLLQYVRNGGCAFPHIMIPEALGLKKQPFSAAGNASGDAPSESIIRRPSQSSAPNSKGELHTDAKNALGVVVDHALWLWNIKQHTSEFLQNLQTRAILAAESWLPLPLASMVFDQIPGTVSAERAAAIEMEIDEGKKRFLTSSDGPVACVAWHPHRSLVAIAHRATDTILLYDLSNDVWCTNILQNAYMQGITSMAWQPNCGYTLAVGCSSGVCLWQLLPSAAGQPGDSKPGHSPGLGTLHFSSWMSLLSYPPLPSSVNTPSNLRRDKKTVFQRSYISVSSLAFDPRGQWLVTGHQTHGHLTVWDVALGTATPLKRSAGGVRAAALKVSVSPNGSYVLSAHANGQMRLWETERWTSRVWSELQANLSHFAWSPDSRSIYFTVEGNSSIFALALYKAPPALEAEITTVTTFESHVAPVSGNESESIRIGGSIKSLAIDPTGNRLVISFDADDASSDVSVLAVYLVNSSALFRAGGDSSALMPLGYIRGPNWGKQHQLENQLSRQSTSQSSSSSSRPDPIAKRKRVRFGLPAPSWFGFAPNFEAGALLTVSWANGKISFVPMLFKAAGFE